MFACILEEAVEKPWVKEKKSKGKVEFFNVF